MKFHDFLESNHVETNIKLQIDYHPNKQARIQAGANLIKAQRAILTWFQYPVLLGYYLLILCHIKSAPRTAQQLVQDYKQYAMLTRQDAAIAKAQEAGSPPPVQAVSNEVPPEVAAASTPPQLTLASQQYNPATETREEAVRRQLARQRAEAAKKDE